MFSEEQITIARNHFKTAAEEFDFEFESPFALTDELEVFGYIPNYGSKNGVVILLMQPANSSHIENKVIDWCKEMDCYYSFLNIELLLGTYKRSYFRQMLRDWGKY